MFKTLFTLVALSWAGLLVSSAQAKSLALDKFYQTFQGSPVILQQDLGKRPIYLKFWASWCLDCREQMPDLEAVYNQYRDALAIYAVNLNINETPKTLQAIKDKYHLTLPIVLDHNGSLASNFQFVGSPFHVLINAQGKVVYTTYHADATLHRKLDQLAHHSLVADSSAAAQVSPNVSRPDLPKGLVLRYFTATWCDSYFVDIEPAMASNCRHADALVKELYQQLPDANWQGYATHLWSSPEDLKKFRASHSVQYPLSMDAHNETARKFQVNHYPTLIVFKDGKEIKRLTHFGQPAQIQKSLVNLINAN
ncbi:MAG: TlpA disulfide reductase family protein [Exilibacterium sp.]